MEWINFRFEPSRPRAGFAGDVLVLYGDAPLVTAATLAVLLAERRRAPEAAAVVLGMRPADPGAYRRLMTGPGGTLEAIVEAPDCTPQQRESRSISGPRLDNIPLSWRCAGNEGKLAANDFCNYSGHKRC